MNNNRRIIRVAQAEDVFSSWILPYMCPKLQRNQNPKEQTASDGWKRWYPIEIYAKILN